jgi:hypothetical protein
MLLSKIVGVKDASFMKTQCDAKVFQQLAPQIATASSVSVVAMAVPQPVAAPGHCGVLELEDLGADYLEELLRMTSEY